MKLFYLMESKNSNIEKQYNYSKAGKFSMQKYSYLIDKNQKTNNSLLKTKNRKKLFNSFFQEPILAKKAEVMDSFFSNEEDIFKEYKPNLSSKNKNNKEFKVNGSCSYIDKRQKPKSSYSNTKNNIINNNFNKTFDKFKYHLLHHNESPNLILKKRISPSCTRYRPKLEYIYKKLIYSISFKKMSGRQNKFKKEDIKKINYNKIKINADKSKASNARDFKLNSSEKSFNSLDKYIRGTVIMKYQLSRQSLPNHNDFRIRKNIDDKNNLSLSDKEKEDIFQKMYKTHFRTSKSSNNTFNFTIYKKSQPSLNILKKRNSKVIVNKIERKEKYNIQKAPINMEESIIQNNILKNDKIKSEIKKNEVSQASQLKVISYNNTDKNNEEAKFHKKIDEQDKEISKSFIDSNYLDLINKKKFLNSQLLTKRNNNSNKNKKAKFFESNSCLNINSFKSKNIQSKNYKGINFEKMLSREYLDKINRYEEPIHPMITPNYSSIDPKSQMKVLYSKREYNLNQEKFHGFNGDFTFDINKIFYKYNNHFSPKTFNFNKMEGRNKNDNDILPLFMQKCFDRNSINNINSVLRARSSPPCLRQA